MKREKQGALLIIHVPHFYILKLLVRKFQTYTKAEKNKRVKNKIEHLCVASGLTIIND